MTIFTGLLVTWRPSPNSKPGWQVVSNTKTSCEVASDSKVESTGTIVKATFFVVACQVLPFVTFWGVLSDLFKG